MYLCFSFLIKALVEDDEDIVGDIKIKLGVKS
jgi:hypothetical protein